MQIVNKAILCSSFELSDAKEAQELAKNIFNEVSPGSESLISQIIKGIDNVYTFIIAPDGQPCTSISDVTNIDLARQKFMDLLYDSNNTTYYIEVHYNHTPPIDDKIKKEIISRSKDLDLSSK